MQWSKKVIILIIMAIFLILIGTSIQMNRLTFPVSDYQLYETSKYLTYGDGGESPGLIKTVDGHNLHLQALDKKGNNLLGSVDDESYMIQGVKISEKLEGVSYFPQSNVLYAFGRDKPINIMFGAPATDSGDPYESPLYIGYYDGTCEYPAEFDYVRSKKKCSQYLQDTLDFVGFDTVDEMLEYAFGEYIIKGEN